MEWITDPQIWISFFTLTVLEIVLGIDNIVFISIQSSKLPLEQQKKARQLGSCFGVDYARGTPIFHQMGDGAYGDRSGYRRLAQYR